MKRDIKILDIGFNNLSRDEVLIYMERAILQKESVTICTPNADHLVQARSDKEFREILDHADLAIPDGMGVVYASWILGTPLKQNVGGRLLLPEFAKIAAIHDFRLFLLGGNDAQMMQRAVDNLTRLCGKKVVSGTYVPPFCEQFDETETGRMIQAINEARADILFACLGTPKQEKWIAQNAKKLNVSVCVGVGCALDILSGRAVEAPRALTGIGMEWLFRLMHEPRRLAKRYLIRGSAFIYYVLKQRLGI